MLVQASLRALHHGDATETTCIVEPRCAGEPSATERGERRVMQEQVVLGMVLGFVEHRTRLIGPTQLFQRLSKLVEPPQDALL
jgi:hypothetical protein